MLYDITLKRGLNRLSNCGNGVCVCVCVLPGELGKVSNGGCGVCLGVCVFICVCVGHLTVRD